MNYVNLGQTDILVSELALGCFAFAGIMRSTRA
jgi:aryl-alcohol dehydrogenase-like predicted oxidoreductase